PDSPFEFTHTTSEPPVVLAQQRLRQAKLAGGNDLLSADELAIELLAALLRGAYRFRGAVADRRRGPTARFHQEQAERTRLLLASRFTENLGLADIARAVHCSTFHLARLFRRHAGMPIHQYRTRLRLRAALEGVIAGEADLTRLALELGFASHSHLTEK